MPTIDKAFIGRAIAAVEAAIGQFNAGVIPHEVCVVCNGTLVGVGLPIGGPYSSWMVHCPCGKSNTTFKGL